MKILGLSLSAALLFSGSAFGIRKEEDEQNVRRFRTPFIPCGEDPSGKGSCLVLDKSIYESLLQAPVDTLVEFDQFITERNTRSILRLKRFSASVDGDDLDKVVLLRGAAAALEDDSYSISNDDYLSSFETKPSRTAFVALSPYGSNGYIEILNSTFMLTTPWEDSNEEYDEEEGFKETRTRQNQYIQSLRSQAQKFLPQMKKTLYDFNTNHISVIFNSAILDSPVKVRKNEALRPLKLDEEGALVEKVEEEEYKASNSSTKELIKTYTLASDVDYDFFKRKGSNANAVSSYYYTLVGHCATIYLRDFGRDFKSSYLKIYNKPDPYPSGINACLNYMKKTWSTTTPARSMAALISGKRFGGVAWIEVLCDLEWAYSVNGDMQGSYPIPVKNYHQDNWDLHMLLHEVGHVWGATHTHEMNPPADKCGLSSSCPPTKGTIMSYCEICQGGTANIELAFHQRNKDEVKPFLASLKC